MNTRNNKRAQDTKGRIVRAVFETMVQDAKPIDKITVREVCEKSHINRSTFYAHFLDIYDVMEQVERTMAVGLTEEFLKMLEANKGLEECFIALFEYVRKNKEFYRFYFSGSHLTGVIGVAWDLLQGKLQNLSYRDFGYLCEEEARYHGIYFIYGFTAMLRHWIERDCAETPSMMWNYLLHATNASKGLL